MSPLLEVKDLHVHFATHRQTVHAVRGVNFFLEPGETLGIVGESGCGKSAMAKALTKLLPTHNTSFNGEIIYGGKNLLTYSESEMQKVRGKEIGMIFQDPMTSLNPTLKIGTQIMEGYLKHHPGMPYSEARQYAKEMLELVGIPQAGKRVDDYPHTLSGGQRQRAMIAVALACKPKILIADEPTTALDVTIQAQILSLMKGIQEKTKTSIVLITHDLSVIAGFCDRVLVMYAGKVVESAPVDDLFYNPQHPYTERLLKAIPKITLPQDHPLVPIEGFPPNLAKKQDGCSFYPRCPHAMKVCTVQEAPIVSISKKHASQCWIPVKNERK